MNELENDEPLGLDEAEGRLVDYLLGQVSEEERRRIDRELSENSLLRVRLYEMRKLVDRVRTAEPPPLDVDLVDGILEEIHEEPAPRAVIRFPFREVAALAACVAIIACVGSVMQLPVLVAMPEEPVVSPEPVREIVQAPAPVVVPVAEPVVIEPVPARVVAEAPPAVALEPQSDADWLASAQDMDGSWDPGRWGGEAQYRDGVTAMALCALLRSSVQPFEGVKGDAATRAVQFVATELRQLAVIQRLDPLRAHDIAFMRAALAEARPFCAPNLQGEIDGALASGRRVPDASVESLQSHLPASAERQGGRVYAVARSVLLAARS